jgi:hypothetical protein
VVKKKFFDRHRSVFVVSVLAVLCAFSFVVWRNKHIFQDKGELIALPNQFPLTPLESGVYELSCEVSGKEVVRHALGEDTVVRNVVYCDFLDSEGRSVTIQIPLALVNEAKNATIFTEKGAFNVVNFEDLAFENASKDYDIGTVVTLELDPTLDYYKLGDPNLYLIIGSWLEQNQTDNLSKFLQDGREVHLPELNGKKTIVPFFVSPRVSL